MEPTNIDNKEKETESIKEIFYIQQEEKKYRLIVILSSCFVCLELSDIIEFMQSYEIELNLELIKKEHKTFSEINSLEEFKKILQDSIEKKEVIITKTSEQIIRFELKKNSIFFELKKKKNNIEGLINNLYIEISKNIEISSELNKKYNEASVNNKILKEEMNMIKKNNEILFQENKKLKDEIKLMKQKEKLKEYYYNTIKEVYNTIKDEIKRQEEINQYENEKIEKLKNEEINRILKRKNSFLNSKEIRKDKYIKYEEESKNNISVSKENLFKKIKGTNTKNNIRNGHYTVNRQKNLGRNRNNTERNLFNDSLYSTAEKSRITKDLFQKKLKNVSNIKLKKNSNSNINNFMKNEIGMINNKQLKSNNINTNSCSKRLNRINSKSFTTPINLNKKRISLFSDIKFNIMFLNTITKKNKNMNRIKI